VKGAAVWGRFEFSSGNITPNVKLPSCKIKAPPLLEFEPQTSGLQAGG